MGFLLLGVDSLIACFAVGALVSRRSWLTYATLFGGLRRGWIPARDVASLEHP
jgi:hypothetical protein